MYLERSEIGLFRGTVPQFAYTEENHLAKIRTQYRYTIITFCDVLTDHLPKCILKFSPSES
jgi:hypothetical protein